MHPLPLLLGGAAALLFAIRSPRLAILLPLVFHAAYLLRSSVGSYPTTGLEILLVAVVAGAWVSLASSPVPAARTALVPWRVLGKLPTVLLAVFLSAATLSVFVSPHARTSLGVWKAMVVEPLIYAITLVTVFTSKRRDNWPIARADALHPVIVALVLGGLVSVGISLAIPQFGVDFGRFRGIYDVPNSLALVVAPLVTLTTVASLALPASRGRLLFSGSAVVFAVALLVTQSLAGVLAVALSLGYSALRFRASRRRLVILLFTFAASAALWQAASGKLPHVVSPVSSSLRARVEIWSVSWALIKDHPILGVGLGTFEPAYQAKLRELLAEQSNTRSLVPQPPLNLPLEWVVRDPHNIILSFWLNTGLLGLLSLSALLALALRRSWVQDPRTSASDPVSLLDSLLSPVVLTLLFFGLLDVPYWKNDLAVLWWVLLVVGIGGAPARRAGAERPSAQGRSWDRPLLLPTHR